MTQDALNQLWMCNSQIQLTELQYWKVADQLMDAGLVDIYDVATIYGVCADTARKRLKMVREGNHPSNHSFYDPF